MEQISGPEYEFLNLYLVLIDLLALGVLGRYIWDLGGRNLRDSELGLGVGLATYILGHMVIRAWTWAVRFWFAQGWGEPPGGVPLQRWLIPVSLVATSVGLVLIVRSLYSTVNARIWAALAAVAALVAVFVTYAI